MNKWLAILFTAPLVAFADAKIGTLLSVRPDGTMCPTGVVATIRDVAQASADAAVTYAKAEVLEETASAASNMLQNVRMMINELEGIGYIRGFVMDFGAVEEVNTNMTSTIVRFDPDVSRDDAYVYSDIYTYFSESPDGFPVCRWTSALGREAPIWEEAESVNITITDLVVGNTYYAEVYKNTVRVPIEYSAAFFRIFAEAKQSIVGAHLPVRNGVKPGNYEPLTATFIDGTNVWKIEGGIRVHPN